MGLSGLGDLALSCFSRTSRNYDFGVRLGGGQNATSLLAAAPVVEGAPTAAAVARRAEALGVDLPICRAVNEVVHHGADLGDTINGLLARPFRTETTEETP